VNNRNIGGGPFGSAPGITGGTGLNNIGLLVRTTGWVTAVVADGFYVDDGAKRQADGGRTGIKVQVTGLASGRTFQAPLVGRYVAVTGALGCADFGGRILPVLKPRSQDDMQYQRCELYGCDFESGLAGWSAMPDSELMLVSDAASYSPTHSAYAGASAAASMHAYPLRQVRPDLQTDYPDRVYLSCRIYDTGGPGSTGKQYITLRALDGAVAKDFFSVGIYSSASPSSYCVRTNAQGWWATAFPRSVGWHKFAIEVRPYTGTDDVWFFIDDVLVAKGKRSVNWPINDLQLGAAGVPGGMNTFYDDVSFGLTE